MTRLLILILALFAGGCVGPTIDFDCPRFDSSVSGRPPFRRLLPPSELEKAIRDRSQESQRATELALTAQAEDSIVQAFAASASVNLPPNQIPEYQALLLSGGGQWGAFGAGFMTRLLDRGSFPDPNLVTGVSTGALQAVFVGAGLSNEDHEPPDWASRGVDASRGDYARRMQYEYRPNAEREIVRRRQQWRSVFAGSMAGLQPLREVIENALCANPGGSGRCMIDDLGNLRDPPILIGLIDAEQGDFYYVNAREIAADETLTRTQRRECVAAAALASAAMPVFFQQVRIHGRTYYDGGVRQSVFIDHAARLGERAIRAAYDEANRRASPAGSSRPVSREEIDRQLSIYVLRNGPTSLVRDPKVNGPGRVWDAAMRAERIVVNQLEVGSVAALRLTHPFGPLQFRSADGWEPFPYEDENHNTQSCQSRKGDGIMFDPDFMRCIMAYGEHIASQAEPWRPLPDIPTLTVRPGAPDR